MYILGDLESDHFGRLHCTTAVMRSINDQVLFVDKRNPPVFEDMPDIDRTGTFPLLTYKHRDDHYSLSILLPILSNIAAFDPSLNGERATVVNIIPISRAPIFLVGRRSWVQYRHCRGHVTLNLRVYHSFPCFNRIL